MTKRSVSEENSRYLSEIIVETEAFRQATHGLVQFKVISDGLGKQIDAKAEPKIVRDSSAMALLDGNGCFGNLAVRAAKATSPVNCDSSNTMTLPPPDLKKMGMRLLAPGESTPA